MINEDSVRAVEAAQWTPHFIKPLYDSYCFSQIPRLIRSALGSADDADAPTHLLGPLAAPYDRVILFCIDALGWRFFAQYYDKYPFLQRIVRDGVVCKLTSQFPSTTAAHVTALHTGLPVGQSGVYEWFYYEPRLDMIIAPLLFSFAGDKERNTLLRANVAPDVLYPHNTLYEDLREQGVRSFVFQHRDYTPSPYNDVVCRGAHAVPYKTLPEALVTLTDILLEDTERSYYFLYFDGIDAIGHRHGPASPHVEAEIDTFLTAMERTFHGHVAGRLHNTLFLMTADHGQAAVDPATTIYLNRQLPHLATFMQTNRAGRLLVPAGSCRDMFLHIKDEHLDEAQATLQDHLEGKAEVYRTTDLIDQGFFGTDHPAPILLGRVGNLVILPYERESVWWYEPDRFDQHYFGHHGGLTRPEMETELLAQRYAC